MTGYRPSPPEPKAQLHGGRDAGVPPQPVVAWRGDTDATMPMPRPARLTPPIHRQRALAAGLLAGCVAWLAGTASAQATDSSAADAALAAQVLDAVNRYREGQQLPALQPSATLAALATEHSSHMAQLRRLSHAGFNTRFERARRTTCVENLAAGFSRAEPMIAGWRQSPDHHRNLLDARVQDVGVASVAGHVTWLACSAR